MQNNGSTSWQGLQKKSEKGPIGIGLVIILIVTLFVVVIGSIGYVAGWFSEAATVTKEEFGPRAALTKYEWFVDQSNAIKKMDSDIVLFKSRPESLKTQYTGYGSDMAKWPPHIQAQYNKDVTQARDDLVAVTSQRNNLVRDYNAQSAKFNWSLYQSRKDLPSQTFEELK